MKFILGVVLAAVVAFFWGYLFWTEMSYSDRVMHSLPNQNQLIPAMQEAMPEDGVYLVPGKEDTEEGKAKLLKGPIAMIMFHAGGARPMNEILLHGFLHMLGSAFLLAMVVVTAGRRSFFGRFVLVFWVGLFLAIWTQMGDKIWWHFPISYACLQMTYHLSSVALMGLILAFFVRPPADPALD